MTNSMSKSARNNTNQKLSKVFGFNFSIKRTEFNTIEVYWPSYSDNNANILLDIYKDKIKYLCKHRSNGISSIVFPSVCRLGRNSIMIDFIEWLFFQYQKQNKKIKKKIQIIFVSQKLVVNINNYEDLKEQILNHLRISHNTIKTNLSLSGYSDDEKENYYYDEINFIELHYDNNINCNKTSSKSTIFINRHSSDNISYIKKDIINKLSVCNMTIDQLLKYNESRSDDFKCKSCQHPVGDHHNPENKYSSDKDEYNTDESNTYEYVDDSMDKSDEDKSNKDESDNDGNSNDNSKPLSILCDDMTNHLSNLNISKKRKWYSESFTDSDYHGNLSKKERFPGISEQFIVIGKRPRK